MTAPETSASRLRGSVRYDEVVVGFELPPLEIPITRESVLRYAGASGDFNPIHWSDRQARALGLPGVIAHGLFTMGQAARVVTAWTGDPGAVVEYSVRFVKPVFVPDEGAATMRVTAKVAALLGEKRVRVELGVVCDGEKVLGRASAVVRVE